MFYFKSKNHNDIYHILCCIVFPLLLLACNKNVSGLEEALMYAGDNRPELENVLQHYKQNPADQLKYKAACFLIENMKYKYAITTDNNDRWIIKSDIKEIKDSLLIAHIDNVFMTKDYSWSHQLSFTDFCEYLLPYRQGTEPLGCG